MKIEQMPQPVTLPEDDRDFRAAERNKRRNIWKKLFGLEKTTGRDIAIEQMEEFDRLIDEEFAAGRAATTEEAIENIQAAGKFPLKSMETISEEEKLRARVMQFASAIEEDDFFKALTIIHEVNKEENIDQQVFQGMIRPIIIEKMNKLLKNKDVEDFLEAFRIFSGLAGISIENFSKEDLQSPEIQRAVKKSIIGQTYNVANFKNERDAWVKLGVIDEKTANELPEVQKEAKKQIISAASVGYSFGNFRSARDAWVNLGVVTKEEVNQLPEVQKEAKKQIISAASVGYSFGNFRSARDAWVNLGVVTKEEVNTWPEVQKEARKQIISAASVSYEYGNFRSARDAWVNLGVVTKEEVNTWPEVVAIREKK